MAIEPSMESQPHPSARMQQGVLILSLPDAIEPVLWKIDTTHYKSLALRITQPQYDNSEVFRLVSNIDNDFSDHVIASFSTKAAALQAMMMAQDALEHLQHPAQPSHSGAKNTPASLSPSEKLTSGPNPWIKYLLKPIFYIILSFIVFVILLFGSYEALRYIQGSKDGMAAPSGAAMSQGSGRSEQSGQPGQSMSAEDFLKDR